MFTAPNSSLYLSEVHQIAQLHELQVAINERLAILGRLPLNGLDPLENAYMARCSDWVKTIRGAISGILAGGVDGDYWFEGFCKSDGSLFGDGSFESITQITEVLALAGYSNWVSLGSTLREDPSPIVQLQDVFGVLLYYRLPVAPSIVVTSEYAESSHVVAPPDWEILDEEAWDTLRTSPLPGTDGQALYSNNIIGYQIGHVNAGGGFPYPYYARARASHSADITIDRSAFVGNGFFSNVPIMKQAEALNTDIQIFDIDGAVVSVNGGDNIVETVQLPSLFAGNTFTAERTSALPVNWPDGGSGIGFWTEPWLYFQISVGDGLTYG